MGENHRHLRSVVDEGKLLFESLEEQGEREGSIVYDLWRVS